MEIKDAVSQEEFQFRKEVIERLTRLEQSVSGLVSGLSCSNHDRRLSALESAMNRAKGGWYLGVVLLSISWIWEAVKLFRH